MHTRAAFEICKRLADECARDGCRGCSVDVVRPFLQERRRLGWSLGTREMLLQIHE